MIENAKSVGKEATPKQIIEDLSLECELPWLGSTVFKSVRLPFGNAEAHQADV